VKAALLIVATFVIAGIYAAPGRAMCIDAVYVDGVLEIGAGKPAETLPPARGQVDVVFPGCNDGGGFEPDGRGSLTRIEGVPPTVAVRDGDTLYVALGQLRMLPGHPLHVDTADRPRCRRGPVVVRRAVVGYGFVGLGRGKHMVALDGRTRLTNRPVTAPLLTGQRVRATTSRCGRRQFADEVTVLAPFLTPERHEPVFDKPGNRTGALGLPWWSIAIAGFVVFAAGFAALLHRLNRLIANG
jgi:hypothetical protein